MIENVKPSEIFDGFLRRCEKLGGDITEIGEVARATVRYLHGDESARAALRKNQELEKLWYDSLEAETPDWTVYDSKLYLAELWACWEVYSHKYLLAIQSPKSLFDRSICDDLKGAKGIVDVGCGLSYTTVMLKRMFPLAEVVGTNLKGALQTTFAERVGKEVGFKIRHNLSDIKLSKVDLVFASEYFEHFPSPVTHLCEVLAQLKPRALLIANAFNATAIGHFKRYVVNDERMDGKQTSRKFNEELRNSGYTKVKTALWNNRPAYWKRV